MVAEVADFAAEVVDIVAEVADTAAEVVLLTEVAAGATIMRAAEHARRRCYARRGAESFAARHNVSAVAPAGGARWV